jgi:hypothetical protein
VPGRPNPTFTGSASTIVVWYFGSIVLAIAVALTGVQWLNNLMSIVQFVLYWLLIKWLVANLASGGQPLGLSFSGSFWAYLGWNILVVLAIITIIGWAWVEVAQLRWLCRNIQGTRREVVFTGTGLEFLWRSIVAVFAGVFIIPLPWMYRWMMRCQRRRLFWPREAHRRTPDLTCAADRASGPPRPPVPSGLKMGQSAPALRSGSPDVCAIVGPER